MKRRTRTALLIAALVAGAMPAAEAGRLTAKRPRQQTYFIVAGLPYERALSTDPGLADPSTSCRDDSAGLERELLGGALLEVPALDGVPLKLDVARKITGRITVESSYAWGYLGVHGVGRPQLRAGVIGLAEGRQVLVGGTTTEAWTITPLETEHTVEFEIAPDPKLAGVALRGLTLTLEIIGPSVGHGLFSRNGRSTLTLPVAAPARRS